MGCRRSAASRSRLAPGWSSSMSTCSRSRSAASTAFSSWRRGSPSARSARVRPGVVTGTPACVIGSGVRNGRCTTMVFVVRNPLVWGTVTSILGASEGRRPQSAAALRWLRTAVRAARQHRREVGAVAAQDGVADGVDAAVEAVQPAGLQPASIAPVEPERQSCVAPDDAVLRARQLGQRPIGRGCCDRIASPSNPTRFSPLRSTPSMPRFVPHARYPPQP